MAFHPQRFVLGQGEKLSKAKGLLLLCYMRDQGTAPLVYQKVVCSLGVAGSTPVNLRLLLERFIPKTLDFLQEVY